MFTLRYIHSIYSVYIQYIYRLTYYLLNGKIDWFNKRLVQNNNYCLSLMLSEERV